MKSLNKARQEMQGRVVRNYEVMDNIYHKVKNKTNDGIIKLEAMMKSQCNNLYYQKKSDLYSLMQVKRKQDELDIVRLERKTKVPINLIKREEEELKRICKEYKIDLHDRKLPYGEKIRQICNNKIAFHKYKKDRRVVLDFSKLKDPEYLKHKEEEFQNTKVELTALYLGESNLSAAEKKRLERIKYLKRKISVMQDGNLPDTDKLLDEEGKEETTFNTEHSPQNCELTSTRKSFITLNSQNEVGTEGNRTPSNLAENLKLNMTAENFSPNRKHQKQKKDFEIMIKEVDEEQVGSRLAKKVKLSQNHNFSMHTSFDRRNQLKILDHVEHLPEIKKLHLDKILKDQIPTTRNSKEKTFLSNMKFGGSTSHGSTARVSTQNLRSVERSSNNVSTRISRHIKNQSNDQMNAQHHDEIIQIMDKRRLKALSYNNHNDIFNSTFDSHYSSRFASTKNDQASNTHKEWDQEQNGGKDAKHMLANLVFKSPLSIRADFTKIKNNAQKIENSLRKRNKDKERLQYQSFKQQTPKLDDEDIKELIKKYPPNALSRIEVKPLDENLMMARKTYQKRALEKILKNIEKVENQNRLDKDKIVYDMLVQNLKEDEFLKTLEKLKELDFAESIVMQTLFEYKLKDEHDQLDLANEVAKEYHSGKLDPLLAMRLERKKKNTGGKVINRD